MHFILKNKKYIIKFYTISEYVKLKISKNIIVFIILFLYYLFFILF